MNNTFTYAGIMLLTGLGIPVMAALNGGLGNRLQSPALAATILFCVSFIVALVYLLATQGLPGKIWLPNTPWYFYFGGFFVAFYVLSITWVAPRFGVSNAVSFVLLGQLISMSIIDHFGLMGAQQFTLTWQRVFGLALMTVGVFMVLGKKPAF
jgi:transporter family-2 protein